MRALTFHGVEDVRCEVVPDPSVRDPRDAIVRVELAGICGSDLHVYHGRERGLDSGTVLGHEVVGVVVEVGRGVRRLRKGVRVVSPFTTSCGACFQCRTGLTARCERGELLGWVEAGRGLHGAQAEYVRVPLADTTLVPVPPDADPGEALLAGDVLATGHFCAELAAFRPGATVVVVGCGPVGLMAIVGARELGAGAVYAIDPVPERRRLAERFGAEPLHPSDGSPVEAVKAATGGRGADAVLEAVGSPEATRLAFELARPGATIAAAGVHTEPHLAFSPREAYDKNLTYRAGRCPARRFLEGMMELVRSRRYPLGALLSHRLPLAAGPRGYELFAARREGCVKVLLAP